jgi:hypothetical protein
VSRFACRKPRWLFGADSFPCSLRRMPLHVALGRNYIQARTNRLVWYVPFDLDFGYAGAAFLDAELPQPTFIIQGPEGRAHILYELEFPVRIDRDSPARHLFEAVRRGFSRRLGADLSYNGLMVKNPLSRKWRTIVNDREFTLTELHLWLEREDVRFFPCVTSDVGRNDKLFQSARFFGYSCVAMHADEASFGRAVEQYCCAHNSFSPPLLGSEVRSISKSVTRWTWERRGRFSDRKTVNRGALGLAPLPLELGGDRRTEAIAERRALAGRITASKRRDMTRKKIEEAVRGLAAAGLPLTRLGVLERTNLSLSTIKRNRDILVVGRGQTVYSG